MLGYPLQVLFLFNSFFVFGACLVLVWLFRKQRDRSANLWVAAGALSAAATALTAFKPGLSLWLGYLLPNTLQVLQQFLLGFALLALCGVNIRLRWVLASVGFSLAYGAVLWGLSLNALNAWLVPCVSLVNGFLSLAISDMLARHQKRTPALRYLRFPQLVLLAMALVWLIRVPLSVSGLAQQALDATLGSWLVFMALLGLNIVLQFSYLGVRLIDALEKRVQLIAVNHQLQGLVSDHDALMRQINRSLSTVPNLSAQTLSAQMVHEVNQPLAALRLKLDALMSFPLDQQDHSPLPGMLANIERISTTMRGLQHLMRGQSPDLQSLDLGDVLHETLGQLQGVALEPVADPLPVTADGPLLARTLHTLVQWLRTYHAPDKPDDHSAVQIFCAASSDGAWVKIHLLAPGVTLDEDARTLLNSGKVLAPIGAAIPMHDVHQLIDVLVVQYALRTQKGHVCVESTDVDAGTTLLLRLPLAASRLALRRP